MGPAEGHKVIVNYENYNKDTEDWCRREDWTYVEMGEVRGTEADIAVILSDGRYGTQPEHISRGRNTLLIVTPDDHNKHAYKKMSEFVDHADKKYKCDRVYNCPYIGQKLVRKVMM